MWEHKIFTNLIEVEEFLSSLHAQIAVEAKIIKAKGAFIVFYRNVYKRRD